MDFGAVKSIILDIEGTTTSISFVKDTLFPLIRKNLTTYLEQNWDKEELTSDIEELKKQALKDVEDGVEGVIAIEDGDKAKESVEKNVLWNMDLDRKTSSLKRLQGHMWREAYSKGEVKGHVYPDVAETLSQWQKEGRGLFIFSSGSVEAQKLLFSHSESGDLLPLIDGHFDTEIGPKTEAESYKAIAKQICFSPEELLFLTDVAEEAEAADKAGMKVAIVIREGNVPLSEEISQKYQTIQTLSDLSLGKCAKRAKISTEEVVVANGQKDKEEVKMDVSEVKAQDEPMETTETNIETTESKTEAVSSSEDTKDMDSEVSSDKTEETSKTDDSAADKGDEDVTSTVAEIKVNANDTTVEKSMDNTNEKDNKTEAELVEKSEEQVPNEDSEKTIKPDEIVQPEPTLFQTNGDENPDKPVEADAATEGEEKVSADITVKPETEKSVETPDSIASENGIAETKPNEANGDPKEESNENSVSEVKKNGEVEVNGIADKGKNDVNGKVDEVATNGTATVDKIEVAATKVVEESKEPPAIEVAAE